MQIELMGGGEAAGVIPDERKEAPDPFTNSRVLCPPQAALSPAATAW